MAIPNLSSIPFPTPTNGTGLLATSWALCITWGLICMQLFTYLQNRRRDHLILQSLVIFLFANETVSTVLACLAVQHQLIVLKPGSFEALFQLPQTALVMVYFNQATLCLVNLFLIWRYQRFTKRWWLTVPLACATLATLGIHWHTSTLGMQTLAVTSGGIDINEALAYTSKMMQHTKVSAALEFMVVASTYILLLIELSSYLRQNLLGGRTIVKRLIFMTLESGTVTVALAAVYLSVAVRRNADPAGLSCTVSCAARAYYMTMLFNLNWRNDGGMVMQEPSLSHISSQLRTRPSIQLSQLSSSGTGQKETVIHIRQDLAIEGDEQYQHEKKAIREV